MDLKAEIFSHTEKLWVLCVGSEATRKPLSSLIDTIDWYNNQLLSKSLIKDQVKVDFLTKTLLATSGQLPVDRLLIFGLGDEKTLDEAQAKIALADLNRSLDGLCEKAPWIILSSDVAPAFSHEFKKSHSKLTHISGSSVTAE